MTLFAVLQYERGFRLLVRIPQDCPVRTKVRISYFVPFISAYFSRPCLPYVQKCVFRSVY